VKSCFYFLQVNYEIKEMREREQEKMGHASQIRCLEKIMLNCLEKNKKMIKLLDPSLEIFVFKGD